MRLIAVLGWFVLMTGAARADKARDEAARFFDSGSKAFEQQRYRDAIVALEEAHKRVPTDIQTIWALGHTYHMQYLRDAVVANLARAVKLYRDYLALGGKKKRERVRYDLQDLEPQLARLEAQSAPSEPPPPGTILVIGSPIADAEVSFDGAPPRKAPAVVDTTAGSHTITVTAPGYESVTRPAVAVAGQTLHVEVQLVARPAKLVVRGVSGTVWIDGKRTGAVGEAMVVEPGRRRVAVLRRGRYAAELDVVFERDAVVRIAPELATTTQRAASRLVLGGAAALLLGAGVTSLVALSAQGDAQDLDDRVVAGGMLSEAERVAYNRALDRRDTWRTTSYVLVGASVAAGVTGALLYWLDLPRVEAPRTIVPVFGNGSAGVAWQRSF